MLHAAAIECPQETDAAVGIVFPAVLAVENDGDQRSAARIVGFDRATDRQEFPHHVAGGLLGVAALIVETDQVGEGVVAEDHVQRLVAALDAPGTIEHLRMPQVPLAVARNPAVGALGEDLLVGRDPLDAAFGNRRDDVLRDGTLGGPHADRRLAEDLLVESHGPPQVNLRVFAVRVEMLGKRTAGHRLPGAPLVPQQRQDRVVEGGRGEFDLPARGELLVNRNHALQDFLLLVEEPGLFAFGVAAALRAELAQFAVLIEGQLVNPGEVAPHLQVANVAGRKAGNGVFDRIAAESALQVQLVIPLVRADHAVDVGQEEIVEQVQDVGLAHSVGGKPRDVEMPIGAPFAVRLQLQQQAGDEVDRAAELGHLLEVQRHAVVVLGRVHAHPGHQRFAADVVRIVRLVLVPEKGNGHWVHAESQVEVSMVCCRPRER